MLGYNLQSHGHMFTTIKSDNSYKIFVFFLVEGIRGDRA